MLTDDKKEEIRDAADIVEVVGDYVRLKKSGNGFAGLCPFHDEKTPSFHVTPRLGIYKCFGCGESGDVYSFIMEMEGVSFPEAMRSLAERYGIDLPQHEDKEQHEEETNLREGIFHALKFSGLYFHRQLHESDDAVKAREYLKNRGYDEKIIRTFGLGYAPGRGDALLSSAKKEGLNEEYLGGADLIKPSNRGDGFYDTFRDRLMFPIFNPAGKVIAFAGRILNENKKSAKYVNSAQTAVYNKSEVVYGVNFAKNDIRKEEEVILVEGYTDVITLYQHGIKNVVASSGTSLTSKQINILQRYGKRIVMIYDADEAGQNAMERGLRIALREGMEVNLLELPDGEDPDSFVKQFGKESFYELKNDKAEDFVTFTIHKAEQSGTIDKPSDRARMINNVLEQIAEIPDEIQRQVFVQHLHQKTQKYRKGSDRELFDQLEKYLTEKRKADNRSNRRKQLSARTGQNDPRPDPPAADETKRRSAGQKKRPEYEKKIIQLLLDYGPKMQKFIGHNVGADQFEDEQLREFYEDIMTRHIKGDKISVEHYSNRNQPFPSLLSDILLERYSVSENHSKATGNEFKKDKFPFKSAKSSMRTLRFHFYERKRAELSQLIKEGKPEDRHRFIKMISKVQKEINKIENMSADMLFDDSEFMDDKDVDSISEKTFVYKMKGEK